ncbi:MAG: hypothetical protein HZA53_17295 [Planctomycetes bacterium]|nr:hypothetical protein [Planctomycetota bacterium]
MKTSLYALSAVCCLAFAASAQVKLQIPAKNPVGGPTPTPPGTSFLLVGGSDDCANASAADAISGLGAFAVTNVGATNGLPDATGCVNTQLDVWFFWTATATGSVDVALCGGATADTVLTVWPDNAAGACPTGTTAIVCNDDSCGLQSKVTFAATSGTSYFFQLGAFGAATTYTGTFTVANTPPPPVPPVNDDCAAPIALAGSVVQPFDNSLATTGTQGQAEALCFFFNQTAIYKDVWFTWVPTVSGTVTVSTCGLVTSTSADTKIAIYDGAGCPTAAAIACNDDAGTGIGTTACAAQGLASTQTFTAVCGQTYTIQLGQFSGAAATNLFGSMSITEDPLGVPCTPQPTAFCAGDNIDANVTTDCPCLNFGALGRGCASSFNASGAGMAATGSPALDNVSLNVDGVNATGNVIYMRGDVNNVVGLVFGDGVRCVDGVLRRRTKPIYAPGLASFPSPTDTVTLSNGWGVGNDTPPGSGITAYYMAYYRNAAAAFCPPETFNGTNGMSIVW